MPYRIDATMIAASGLGTRTVPTATSYQTKDEARMIAARLSTQGFWYTATRHLDQRLILYVDVIEI